jgi:hypothetical protein
MNFRTSISNKLLLGAIFFGLNVLCFVGITHGSHAHRHTRVNYSHIPAHGTGRSGSRSGRSETVVSVDSQVDYATAAPGTHGMTVEPTSPARAVMVASPVMALVVSVPLLERPTMMAELLARENVLALGSAPRAPGRGRGPPTA